MKTAMLFRPKSRGTTAAPAAGATLGNEDFQFLRELIYERSRINLGPEKRVLITSRLAKRLRELNLECYSEYCALLRSPAGEQELTFLIDRISTNHTHFFREQKHFEFLEKKFLPAWRAKQTARGAPLRVWSAASSTGEEPYTIAIHLAEHLAAAEEGAWQIEATDISTRVLGIARQGVYEVERLAGVSPEQVRRYFQKGVGEREGQFRVKADLRERVRFHHLNLLQPPYPFKEPFHLIFCRNVMIYFDRPTQEALVSQLTDCLVPGGHLLVGHSESLGNIKHSLKLVQPAVYLKPGA
ncbi:MAG TPA: protein-glutamate O-methyltransferase [Candidatus Acidoferrales bacterium]|jgi:chemotaxis protein methyltransferase CheR|nr:protein-glutamate O-methyltransferase [Candidatus Acidoferrales bacterium]